MMPVTLFAHRGRIPLGHRCACRVSHPSRASVSACSNAPCHPSSPGPCALPSAPTWEQPLPLMADSSCHQRWEHGRCGTRTLLALDAAACPPASLPLLRPLLQRLFLPPLSPRRLRWAFTPLGHGWKISYGPGGTLGPASQKSRAEVCLRAQARCRALILPLANRRQRF